MKSTPGQKCLGVSFYVLDVGIGLLVLSLVVAVIPEEFSRGSVLLKKGNDRFLTTTLENDNKTKEHFVSLCIYKNKGHTGRFLSSIYALF